MKSKEGRTRPRSAELRGKEGTGEGRGKGEKVGGVGDKVRLKRLSLSPAVPEKGHTADQGPMATRAVEGAHAGSAETAGRSSAEAASGSGDPWRSWGPPAASGHLPLAPTLPAHTPEPGTAPQALTAGGLKPPRHPSAHCKDGWLPHGAQHPACPLPCLTQPTPCQRPRTPENPVQFLKPCSGPPSTLVSL